MKKLGKLKLNPEKLLSHEELVSFRGGSGMGGACGAGCLSATVAQIEYCFWDVCGGTSSGTCCFCCLANICGFSCA